MTSETSESRKNSLAFMVVYITNNRDQFKSYEQKSVSSEIQALIQESSSLAQEGVKTSSDLFGAIPPKIMWVLQKILVTMPRLAYRILKITGVHHRAI